jgi:hypothetical protein
MTAARGLSIGAHLDAARAAAFYAWELSKGPA